MFLLREVIYRYHFSPFGLISMSILVTPICDTSILSMNIFVPRRIVQGCFYAMIHLLIF